MSKSSSRNPMELVDRYLQAVRFWLPKSRNQDDLIAELGEDLRSQIEEKENELGRPLDQGEVGEILKRCGSPMVVGSRLGPSRSLIGPVLYPTYLFVLKMVLFWIMVPVFIFILGPINVANSSDWGTAIASTIGQLWSGLFISAGIITLVFAIVERTQAVTSAACKWDPDKLPPLEKPERKTSLAHTASELIFNVFGFVWLLLVPHHLWMLLGPAASFLKPAPMWHSFYVPVLLLAVWAIARLAIIVAKPQWNWFPLASQLLQSVLTLILLKFVFNTLHAHGNAFPFLTLADSVTESAKYVKILAIVNVSIMISLACTWFGVGIGTAVQTWQLLKLVRRQVTGGSVAVSSHVL